MAEFVQQSIEHMLPELEELTRIKLFSPSETRAILKKRKAFEYRLRRRTKEKEDIIQYVQYEINVLALIRKRREKNDIQHKKLEIDLAIVQRVHSLFRMACNRFQDDVNLWLSHIEFAKKRGENSTVSRLMMRMLQVNPRRADLWIMASQWEFESGKSSENARTLFQRGLRYNPESRELWLEYYRMELLNVDKLKKRREILGIEEMDVDNDDSETIKQNDSVLQGKVAAIVFKKASEAFPDDAEFCLSFIQVCSLFDFTDKMLEEMIETLKEKFGTSELYWNVVARREGGDFLKEKKCGLQAVLDLECRKAEILSKACEDLKTEKMWDLHIQFWLGRIRKKSSADLKEARVEKCLQAFDKAEELELLSEGMKIERIKLLITLEKSAEVKRLCKQATDEHPKNVELWILRFRYLIDHNQQIDSIVDTFKRSMTKFDSEDFLPLWEMMLEFLSDRKSRHLIPLLEVGIKQKSTEISLHCKSQYLDYVASSDGLKPARKLFVKLSETLPINKEFYKKYINLELSEPKPKMGLVRKSYESCVDRFGKTDIDVWLDYLAFEQSQKQESVADNLRVTELHWKAMRSLSQELSEEFTQRYTLMMTTD